MGNSRIAKTASPDREVDITQVETPNAGKETLTNLNTVVQESLGENNSENQLTEPSQINYEIQVWTQFMEQKTNDMIEKMREEMEKRL